MVGKPPCLGSYFAIFEASSFACALLFNATLAALIIRKTSKELRAYSRVLLCNCVVDSLFTTVSFLVEPHLDIRSGTVVMVINGPMAGDLRRNLVLLAVYFVAICTTIVIAAVPMLFRYITVCRGHVMSTMQFALMIHLALIVSCFTPIIFLYTWWPSALETTRKYADVIENFSCRDVGQIFLFPLSEATLWVNSTLMLVGGTVVTSAYAAIVFSAYRIRAVAKRMKHWSDVVRDVQRQIHAALLFQAATPLLLDIVPIGLGAVAILGGFEQFGAVFPFIPMLLAWIPVINPLSTILFVRCYRTAIRDICLSRVSGVNRFIGAQSFLVSSSARNVVQPSGSSFNVQQCL